MNAADRIALLEVHNDVHVVLAPAGLHLDVTGPYLAVDAAAPMLMTRRTELLARLQNVVPVMGRSPARPVPAAECTSFTREGGSSR